MTRKFLSTFALILLLTVPTLSQATNGYWSHGYGPKSKSMAGACVAMAFGAMCAASNPGSLALVGNRLEIGAAVFAPTRGFTANDDAQTPPFASIPAGKYESDNDYFLIPHFAYNKMIDNSSAIGIAIGGNGGMNTEYDSAIFQNFTNPNDPSTVPSSPTGIDLMQLFVATTYSKKLNNQHSLGIAPIVAAQSVEVTGLQPFTPFSAYPDKVTDNGQDISYGLGLKVGWLWQINTQFDFGLSYQSEISMSKFEDYKGLFAEGGNFDIPSNYDIGFAYHATPNITLAFNYQHINFSDISAIGNPSNLVFAPGSILLGTPDGLGFGWKDVDVAKFGAQWKYRSDLTLRAGYSQASDAFPSNQALFNTLAPAVVKKHYTFGLGKTLDKEREVNIAFMYTPNEKVHGINPNTGPQTGFLEISEWEIEIGWAKRF